MSKHSGGKWEMSRDGDGEYGIHADAGKTWKHVATVTANDEGEAKVGDDEAEANARLIAAAPEMFQLVLDVLKFKGSTRGAQGVLDELKYRAGLVLAKIEVE